MDLRAEKPAEPTTKQPPVAAPEPTGSTIGMRALPTTLRAGHTRVPDPIPYVQDEDQTSVRFQFGLPRAVGFVERVSAQDEEDERRYGN